MPFIPDASAANKDLRSLNGYYVAPFTFINPPSLISLDGITPMIKLTAFSALLSFLMISACTQETQNQFGRAVQNWTGTDGVLEIYAGDKLVKRFLNIDKLTTAVSTQGEIPRPYRYGYGVIDLNLNGNIDAGEKKVYFEFSDYSTSYVFFESPG